MRRRPFLAFFLTLFLILIAGGAYLWHQRYSIERRFVDAYIARIQPDFPLHIDSVTWKAGWQDLRKGSIPVLRIELSRELFHVVLEGPLTFRGANPGKSSEENLFAVTYHPRVELRRGPQAADPFELQLQAEISRDLNRANSLKARIREKKWAWPAYGVSLKDLAFRIVWENEALKMELGASELAYADALRPDARLAQIGKTTFSAKTNMSWAPFGVGPNLQGKFATTGGEILLDDTYLDLPLTDLPLEFAAQIVERRLDVKIPHGQLSIVADQDRRALSARWKFDRLPLAELAKKTASWTWLSALSTLEVKGGVLSTQGQARVQLNERAEVQLIKTSGRLQTSGLALRMPAAKLALRGGSFSLPFEWQGRVAENNGPGGLRSFFEKLKLPSIRMQVEDFWFRHLHGKITPWRANFNDGRFVSTQDFPLTFDHLALKVGPMDAAYGRDGYQFHTQARIEPTLLQPILTDLCIKARLPQTSIKAHWPSIEINHESFQPEGELQLDALGGQLRVREVAVFDWQTSVPETDFDAEWSGFRLDEVGKFLNFGKMDGTLVGRARGVVMQGALPTQYDFTIEAKPMHKKDIVFSPDAMRNFVKLVTGQDIAMQLPGILRWIYFGWPRRVTGGYDVLYAGISLFSRDGSILLETLDPPERMTKQNERFILYGGRDFRMPLKSSRYPVVLDAPAVANYVARMTEFFGELSRNKQETTHDEPKPILDSACEPPEF